MQKLLGVLGSVIAIAGVLMCLIAGIFRLSGYAFVGDFEAVTLFAVGTGVMVFACWLKLELLVRKL